jgi:hypothetical protein
MDMGSVQSGITVLPRANHNLLDWPALVSNSYCFTCTFFMVHFVQQSGPTQQRTKIMKGELTAIHEFTVYNSL